MAEAHGDDDDIFVYMGGDQQVPRGVRRAKIHKSVRIIPRGAFQNCEYLISVEFHDGVEIIEEEAFRECYSFEGPIKLLGVKIIKEKAFWGCESMADVEFGDKLETIGKYGFRDTGLKKIRMPSVRTIGVAAFADCFELFDVECGEGMRTLQGQAFDNCWKLKRIALPLKDNMIEDNVFFFCKDLTTIDLVGGIHQTVASLHLESWRNEMNNEIIRINQTLLTINDPREKTAEIQQWMRRVLHRLDHYKTEHKALLTEATTLLELALWKAGLSDNNGGEGNKEEVTALVEMESSRDEIRYTSGADIVIKNVLPFLALKL